MKLIFHPVCYHWFGTVAARVVEVLKLYRNNIYNSSRAKEWSIFESPTIKGKKEF